MSRLVTAVAGLTIALGWGLAAGCSDDSDEAASGGGGAGPGAGGAGGSFTTGSSSGGFEACAEATLEGERIPVQMLIMFDKSQSMLEDQKWAGATAALLAFFRDEESAGLNVALRFFPDDTCDSPACDINACATPLVPVGELNGLPAHSDPQQQALEDAVTSRSPSGQTPMYAALAGAEQWAVANAVGDGMKTVVVLVTDGAPNGCEPNPDTTASYTQVVADARSSAGVLTYTVGMVGADLVLLEALATAGGTDAPFVVGSGSVHSDLVGALRAIGTAPIECSFPVPEGGSAGTEVDPNLVNLTYRAGADADPETIPQVGNEAACDDSGGWYYDDPQSPTEIHLCPATCEMVQGGPPDAALEIVLGCATVVK
jgi:hypothetical protein